MGSGLGGTSLNQTNERLSASLAEYAKGGAIADNIKTRNVTLDFFMDEGITETYDQTGTELAVRMRYKKMSKLGEGGGHVGTYSYYSKLNTQPSDTIKTGRETWTNFNVPITLSHQEQDENKGKKQFDRLKEKTTESEDNLAENVNDVLWGVAGGDTSTYFASIPSIVSGADAGTINGLAKASNTWLYSQESTSIGDAATYLLDKMTEGYNQCVDNAPNKSDKLDIFLMRRQVFQVIQGILPAYINYTTNKNVDIGFPTVVYMGVPCRFDSTIPQRSGADDVYGLMKKYWEMAILKSKNFTVTPFFNRLPDEASDVAQLFLTTCVINKNPRTNWRGGGVTGV